MASCVLSERQTGLENEKAGKKHLIFYICKNIKIAISLICQDNFTRVKRFQGSFYR
jgi:hypothetical protein